MLGAVIHDAVAVAGDLDRDLGVDAGVAINFVVIEYYFSLVSERDSALCGLCIRTVDLNAYAVAAVIALGDSVADAVGQTGEGLALVRLELKACFAVFELYAAKSAAQGFALIRQSDCKGKFLILILIRGIAGDGLADLERAGLIAPHSVESDVIGHGNCAAGIIHCSAAVGCSVPADKDSAQGRYQAAARENHCRLIDRIVVRIGRSCSGAAVGVISHGVTVFIAYLSIQRVALGDKRIVFKQLCSKLVISPAVEHIAIAKCNSGNFICNVLAVCNIIQCFYSFAVGNELNVANRRYPIGINSDVIIRHCLICKIELCIACFITIPAFKYIIGWNAIRSVRNKLRCVAYISFIFVPINSYRIFAFVHVRNFVAVASIVECSTSVFIIVPFICLVIVTADTMVFFKTKAFYLITIFFSNSDISPYAHTWNKHFMI